MKKGQSPGQMNAPERGKQNSGKKNKETIKREPVEDTPFEIITANKKCFIGMGSYRMSEEWDVIHKSELHRHIQEKNWMLIMHTINALVDARERMKAQEKKSWSEFAESKAVKEFSEMINDESTEKINPKP